MQAIILAAGFGTRLKPLTDHTPKALVKCAGKCMIDHAIAYLESYGFDRIIINVHHFGEQIIEHINNNQYKSEILISDERAELKDTGGALVFALPLMNDEKSILIFNTDVITNLDLQELASAHESSDSSATLIVQERESTRKLVFNAENHLNGWYNYKTEESIGDINDVPESSFFAFSGIHMIDRSLVERFAEMYGDKPFPMIPAYLSCINEVNIQAYKAGKDTVWLETGSQERLKDAEEWVKNGRC
ncbi:MAG: NTP transferase domain-containing protein [Saprospiraceae bacterium]|nr:sugar phosphate nucleotidyltransferase [Candidatus Brachybacter algidus]MBL0120892.1 NTP transferase domain-containing protein [Candidatus Brachybacter algidus]